MAFCYDVYEYFPKIVKFYTTFPHNHIIKQFSEYFKSLTATFSRKVKLIFVHIFVQLIQKGDICCVKNRKIFVKFYNILISFNRFKLYVGDFAEFFNSLFTYFSTVETVDNLLNIFRCFLRGVYLLLRAVGGFLGEFLYRTKFFLAALFGEHPSGVFPKPLSWIFRSPSGK